MPFETPPCDCRNPCLPPPMFLTAFASPATGVALQPRVRDNPEWMRILDQLEIPDGAVAGLSAADKPTIEGKLLQLPAENQALFFRGQHSSVLKSLRTLLPDVPSGEAMFTKTKPMHSTHFCLCSKRCAIKSSLLPAAPNQWVRQSSGSPKRM